MRLSIGPCLFEWGKSGLRDFYRRMANETEADILYLGEVVCSKRATLNPEELATLAEELEGTGKEVAFSTLGLVMNEPEMATIRRLAAIAREQGVLLEANDLAAFGIAEGQPLVAGPHITTYNPETLDFLMTVGVKRVVLPVELSADSMASIIARHQGGAVETEVFAHGKLPLTFSARCYTARAFNLPKSNCQYRCGDYPDGLTSRTQEGQPFLTINGIQTMSDRLFCVADQTERLAGMGVEIVRISPQSKNMVETVAVWKQRLAGSIDGAEALARLIELNGGNPFCNGYFHGRAGLDFIDAAVLQAEQNL